MIVFNFYAVPVIIVIGILYGGLTWLAPKFMETGYGSLTVGLLSFVVGTIAEFIGIKGRLFWLPIWLLGLGYSGYQAWTIWGWMGAVVGVVSVVGGIAMLVLWSRSATKKAWEKAPDELRQARQAFSMGNADEAFEHLEQAYVSPWGDFTREMCAHNLQLIDLMLPHIEQNLTPKDSERLAKIRRKFEKGSMKTEDTELKDGDDDWLEEVITSRGSPEKDDD